MLPQSYLFFIIGIISLMAGIFVNFLMFPFTLVLFILGMYSGYKTWDENKTVINFIPLLLNACSVTLLLIAAILIFTLIVGEGFIY